MIRQIVVLVGAAAAVDGDVLRSHCMALGDGLGVTVEPRFTTDTDEMVAFVDDLGADTGAVIVVDDLAAQRRLAGAVDASTSRRVASVELESAFRPRDPGIAAGDLWSVRGRGLEGIRWAARTILARSRSEWITARYGPLPEQVGDLRMPHPDGGERRPVVVLVHGGAWRERWERDLMDDLAVDLAERGYGTWNIEYRRVGPSGGGWPTTFQDVGDAIDHLAVLADQHPLDLTRVAFAGHSAGGHLAVWAAARSSLPADAPGAAPAVTCAAVLSLAGVLDLIEMGRRGSEEGATMLFMGGLPDEIPDRYALASPAALLPIGGCPQLIAYGTADRLDLVDNNRRYCDQARAAGDQVEELALPGADHFHVIDPRTSAWTAIMERFDHLFPVSGGATRQEAPL